MKFTLKSDTSTHVVERACADCEAYTPAGEMVTKQDGRSICKPCDRKAKDKGAARAQLEFFGQQSLI